jgi:hypothetical protein
MESQNKLIIQQTCAEAMKVLQYFNFNVHNSVYTLILGVVIYISEIGVSNISVIYQKLNLVYIYIVYVPCAFKHTIKK